MIRIELSSEKKRRNEQEWRNIPTATADGIKIASDGPLMPKIAKALIDAGHDPQSICEAWRGDVQCFYAKTLSEWASGKALNGEQPEQFRRATA